MSNDDCAIITWAINNYSNYWQKIDEAIESPMFRIYMPEETKWKLLWFPSGVTSNATYTAFFLYRDKDCTGPENIQVHYRLEILNHDSGAFETSSRVDYFQKNVRLGFSQYTVLFKKDSSYLLQDMLTIRCKLINFNVKAVEMSRIFAGTIVGVEEPFFQWPIENFSSLAPDQKQSFVIKSKDVLMLIDFVITGENEESVCLSIDYFNRYIKFSVVKIFIIDSTKQKVNFGEFKYWTNCGKGTMFPLKLTKKKLIENKCLYLPNDVLTLSFEFTELAFEGREMAICEYISQPLANEGTQDWQKSIAYERMSNYPCASLIADLSSLLKDQILCDMKLKTKTNNIPVHTSILGARSPVFRAMFSSDMIEKVNGCVDVSDLEDETVRRFLLYLYSDQLEDLKWDDALQLYKTADRYAVISLRDKCSTFFNSRLNVENACEALTLSDLHQDKNLKEKTQNFILKNGKVIFNSDEWKLLADNYPKLAIETMLRNWNEE